ncbi:hypothetical protein AOLI_G00213560 [Acnodon oligacanthus]
MTGPSFDHTTGSGHYIYIEGDSATHGDTARLLSKECTDPGPQCLQFWYHIYGSSWTMGLDLYLLHGNDAREVWRLRENKGNTWYRALVPLIPRGNFQVIFEGRRGDNAWSDVAVDDISLHRGTCEDLLPPPLPDSSHPVCRINCDFEKDLCTWNQYLADVFDWTRHSGSTPTPLTGPSFDHTTGSGHYAYIEGDSATHGDTARLLSEECSDVQPQCLQFWYHMYGSSWTMGLTVYLMYGNHPREVWRLREDKGNTWHRALVNLKPQGNFKIIFEGRRGADTRSDIAVDDISLHRGTCEDLIDLMNSVPSPSKPEHPIVSTPVSIRTTTLQPCTETTAVKSQNTGASIPANPNTPAPSAASGHYIYIEGDSATHGDTARLLSEECSDVQPQCLQFWYHMYGSSWTMGLTVYLLHGNQAREVWRLRENQENIWHRALVDFTPHGNFKIIFEGRRGDNAWSDVAVDDISLHRGTCEGFSKCSIEDDPEYRTFDNFKHKFKGKHSYVLVQTSNLPNNVPEVYIEGINQKSREQENRDEGYDDEDLDGRERHDHDDSSEEDDDDGRLRALRIRVYNHTVELREGRKVMVNGVLARAPVFPTPGLTILERSSRLYLQTDFGLSVEFKGKGKAEISLPDTYKTKVGGLCGNYDGRKNNDMMKPNGQQAKNVKEFGESWRVVAEKAAVRRRRSSLLYALSGPRQ